MTARVLVVDDVLANVKLMEARLTAERVRQADTVVGLEEGDLEVGTDAVRP